jgi:hypothetical protein
MSPIEKIIRENQDEFVNLVVKFVEEKTTTKVKKNKRPKIICHFNVLGKNYTSDKFVDNYKDFLLEVSRILNYDKFEPILLSYVKKNENKFTDSYEKTSIVKLHNGGFVSTHSGSQKKIDHIDGLCKIMNATITKKYF